MDGINKAISDEINEVRSNNAKDDSLLEISKSLIDMENIEQSDDPEGNLTADFNEPNEIMGSPINFIGNIQSGLVSTTRPLVTSIEDEMTSGENISVSLSLGGSEICDNININDNLSLTDISSDVSDKRSIPHTREQDNDDALSIRKETVDECDPSEGSVAVSANEDSTATFKKVQGEEVLKREIIEPNTKDPKVVANHPAVSESVIESGFGAYESFAQPFSEKKQVAMESESSSCDMKKSDCDCPFSPGSWFNPEKLHPTVAGYVYWQDIKKSGIAFGSSLVLLLSLKYFSLISVVAYVTLAILSVTISFRIYKNVLQAVQKSNEGHPFKAYLDLDINLSHDKLKDTTEVLIHHVNCVATKMRSLVLVEDLFDTIKLGVLAWCLTYVGAWFNGITLVILGLVSVFTVPKVYETNKTQIDSYAEILRTKGKELIEMINAKMPLGKKKKEQ